MEYPTCNSQNGEGETSKCFAIGLLRTKGLNKYYLMDSNACSHYKVQFNDFTHWSVLKSCQKTINEARNESS